MFRNACQRGLLTVFYGGGAKPLQIWECHTQSGYVSRFLDQEIKSMVLEIGGTNITTSFMVCPKGNEILGITMPFLVMVVRNLKKYFSFEVTILDDSNVRRRFRVSNFQSTTQILPLCTVMPLALSDGWNQIQFNLAEFTRRAYKKQFVEVQKLKINANIRIRRIYFAERLLPEDELPPEYKLYMPIASKGKGKKVEKEEPKAEVPKVPSATKPQEVPAQAPGTPTEVVKAEQVAEPIVAEDKKMEGEAVAEEQVAGEMGAGEGVHGEEPAGEQAAGEAVAGEEGAAEGEEEAAGVAPGEASAEGVATPGGETPAEGAGEAPAETQAEASGDAPAEGEPPTEAPPAEEPAAAEG